MSASANSTALMLEIVGEVGEEWTRNITSRATQDKRHCRCDTIKLQTGTLNPNLIDV